METIQAIIHWQLTASDAEVLGVVLAFGAVVLGILFAAAALVDVATEAAAMRRRRNRRNYGRNSRSQRRLAANDNRYARNRGAAYRY